MVERVKHTMFGDPVHDTGYMEVTPGNFCYFDAILWSGKWKLKRAARNVIEGAKVCAHILATQTQRAAHTTTSPAGAMVARKTSIQSYQSEQNLEAVGSSPTWGCSFCVFLYYLVLLMLLHTCIWSEIW
jgi:hypothetical protein